MLHTREVSIGNGNGNGTYTWLFDEDIEEMIKPGYRAKIKTNCKKRFLYMTDVSFPGLSPVENNSSVMTMSSFGSSYRVDCHNIPEFWLEISDTFDSVNGRFPGPRKHIFIIDQDKDVIQVQAFDARTGIIDPSFTISFMLRIII